MFIYEDGNCVKINLKSNFPVEAPDLVLKGFKNGAALYANGLVFGVLDGEEFEEKANTIVYQRANKLMITFNGVNGMSKPEAIIDEFATGSYHVTLGDQELNVIMSNEGILVESNKLEQLDYEIEPFTEEEELEEIPETNISEEEPEEPVEE